MRRLTGRNRRAALCSSWAPLLTALTTLTALAVPARAAEGLEELFNRDWYYTEVIVFQRPAVQDHAMGEALAGAPRPLPPDLRTFRLPEEELRALYQLSPLTRLNLTYPYLDTSLLPPELLDLQLELDGHPRADDDDRDDPWQSPRRRGRERTPYGQDEEEISRAPAEDAGREESVPPTAEGAVPPPDIDPRLAADPLLDLLRELAEYEAALEADSYRWLDPETFSLTGAARAVARRSEFQVLLHGRWLQPVPARGAPQPLFVHAGPRYGNTFALEGTFDVTLGRYLHFRAGLYYTEPLLGRSPLNQPLAPVAGPMDESPPAESPRAESPRALQRRLTEQDLEPAGYMQLHATRRLRSGELHYLDHPRLGVLVLIEPAAPPEHLVAAYEALQAQTE